MTVLFDSSCWIEYFLDGVRAEHVETILGKTKKEELLTPTLVLFEVYKILSLKSDEQKAKKAVAYLTDSTTLIGLTAQTAVFAAELSIKNKLGMADAIVLASARLYNAQLKTLDKHFLGIKGADVF